MAGDQEASDRQAPDPLAGLRSELELLRDRVIGVRGSIVAGVDGLCMFQDGATGEDPHDIAAMAAATYGIGQQAGRVLRGDAHQDTTIHCRGGYLVVYSITDGMLLAVLAEAGINVARLHVEFRAGRPRLRATLAEAADHLVIIHPKL